MLEEPLPKVSKKSGFIKIVVKVRLKKFDSKVYSVTAEDMIMI